MNLNVLLRGQSNAVRFGAAENGTAVQRLVQDVQHLLGLDGVTDTVTLHFRTAQPDANTATGSTAFLTDWIRPISGDWHNSWNLNAVEQGLLDYIARIPATQRDD